MVQYLYITTICLLEIFSISTLTLLWYQKLKFKFFTLGSALSKVFFVCVKLCFLLYWMNISWMFWYTVLKKIIVKSSQNTVVFIEMGSTPWWHRDSEDVWIYFYVRMLWINHRSFFFLCSFLPAWLQDITFYFLASITCELAHECSINVEMHLYFCFYVFEMG